MNTAGGRLGKESVQKTGTEAHDRQEQDATHKILGESDAEAAGHETGRAAPTGTARRKTAARAAATRAERQNPTPKSTSKLAAAAVTMRGTLAGAVAVVADRLPWTGTDKPDAIALLETDHRRFEDLLKRGEESTVRAKKSRRELLDTLTRELNAHELIEEKILYPTLQQHPEATDIVLEGYEEHHVADIIVKELHDVATDDAQWGAKFKVLKESLEHHIKEEERTMFRTARGLLTREELHEMGARMQKLKSSARRA